MAGELQAVHTTGRTVYFLVRSSTGTIWNGSAFEAYLTANYTNYDIAATEQGTASGFYTATMPAATAGIYSVVAKEQAGGSPAETDLTIAEGDLLWSGTTVVPPINAAGLQTDAVNEIADGILSRDLDQAESTAAVHSLLTACLKLVSKFDVLVGGNAVTYRTDGTTVHATQARTNNASLVPVQSLGAAT